jgi:hypothetical protein
MCTDSRFLGVAWLIAAVASSLAVIVGARSPGGDSDPSTVARRLSELLGLGAAAVLAVGLALGAKAAINASAGPAPLHGVDLVWIVVWRSRAMSTLSVLLAAAGAVSLALSGLRSAGASRTRAIVGGVVVATGGSLGLMTLRERRDHCEPIVIVREIQIAQESYRAENRAYANVSTGLAANQDSNHQALYPPSPSAPGSHFRRWNVPCAASACNAGFDWSVLPVHVDGPVAFGYSTVAGRAGERPTANVSIGGRPVRWPVPEEDWYIVTAVGDPTSAGEFVTVVGSSFTKQLLIDVGGK